MICEPGPSEDMSGLDRADACRRGPLLQGFGASDLGRPGCQAGQDGHGPGCRHSGLHHQLPVPGDDPHQGRGPEPGSIYGDRGQHHLEGRGGPGSAPAAACRSGRGSALAPHSGHERQAVQQFQIHRARPGPEEHFFRVGQRQVFSGRAEDQGLCRAGSPPPRP